MSTCILYRSTEYVYFRDMGHGVKGNDTLSEFLGYLVGFQLLCRFGILWASLGIDRWDAICGHQCDIQATPEPEKPEENRR